MKSLRDEDNNALDDYGTMTVGRQRSDDKKPILFDDVSPVLYISDGFDAASLYLQPCASPHIAYPVGCMCVCVCVKC